MAENRKRGTTLTIRVTKAEKASVAANAKRARKNLTDYILALNEKVTICPPPDLAPVLTELKRIGSNINQVAAKVNSGVAYVPGLERVVENQNALVSLISKTLEDRSWQP